MKSLIHKLFRCFGLEVHRAFAQSLVNRYKDGKIDVVLDVGANTGQFGQALRRGGYFGTIVSFEPLSDAHSQLTINSNSDIRWIVHERCALGSENSIAQINISKNSVSSSLLNMRKAHLDAAPNSVYVGVEEVKVVKLDNIWANYISVNDRIALKIDAQGFESQILKGCGENLRKIQYVQMELSLVPLYDGQGSYLEHLNLMNQNGFVLIDVVPGFRDPISRDLLQFDGVFEKR